MLDFRLVMDQFDQTLKIWRRQLTLYSYSALTAQPNAKQWSVGQVAVHLVEETSWYIDQIEACLKANEHADKSMATGVREWFANNSFPNKKFKGPPDIAIPPQPTSKDALLSQWDTLADKIKKLGVAISTSQSTGKAKHPSHGYLSAQEWFHYAEMHLRHHFRQKERIDQYLSTQWRMTKLSLV